MFVPSFADCFRFRELAVQCEMMAATASPVTEGNKQEVRDKQAKNKQTQKLKNAKR